MEWEKLQEEKFRLFLLMQDLQEELEGTNDPEERKLILEEMEKLEEEIIKLVEETDKRREKKITLLPLSVSLENGIFHFSAYALLET